MILFKRDLVFGGSYGSSTLDLASAGGSGVLDMLIRGTREEVNNTASFCRQAVSDFIADNNLENLKTKPKPPYVYHDYTVTGRAGYWQVKDNRYIVAYFRTKILAYQVVYSAQKCVRQFRMDNNILEEGESGAYLPRSDADYIDAWLRAKKRGIDLGERSYGAKIGSIYDRRGNVVYTSHTIENEKEPNYEYRRWAKRELPLAHLERRLAEWSKPLPPDWIAGHEFMSFPRSKRTKAMVAIMDGVISMIDSKNDYDFDGWDSFLDNYRDFRNVVLTNKDKSNSKKLERYQDLWSLPESYTNLQAALFVAMNGINEVAFAKIPRQRIEPQIAEIAVAIYEWLGVDNQEKGGVSASRNIVLNAAEKAIS